jgi:hypothetical protein
MKRLVVFAGMICACAAPVDVLKVTSPSEASAANGTKLHAFAVVRGKDRAPLPPEATVAQSSAKPEPQGWEVRVPRPGLFTYALDPGETVVRDEEQRVIGVQSGANVTKFIAGTATLEGNEVHGELDGHVERLPLLPTDRVELRGTFAPGEIVPTGGKIEVTRTWSALAFGGALLGGAWIPSIVVAATSSIDANHWLYLPVLGPWIAYVTRNACVQAVDPTPCLTDAADRVALIADGIFQGTGALLMVLGIPTSAEVRWSKQARARITPLVGLRTGLSIEGTF